MSGEPVSKPTAFDRRMLEALICPRTQTTLRYDADRQELAGLSHPQRDSGDVGR